MIPEFNKHLCSTYLVPGPRMGAVEGYGVGVRGSSWEATALPSILVERAYYQSMYCNPREDITVLANKNPYVFTIFYSSKRNFHLASGARDYFLVHLRRI